MHGPKPAGHWTSNLEREAFKHLRPGRRYEVVTAFTDHRGSVHPVGETWVFLTYNFVPYHDGLSLIVSLDGTQEWHIPLLWAEGGESDVIHRLKRYVRRAAGDGLLSRLFAGRRGEA